MTAKLTKEQHAWLQAVSQRDRRYAPFLGLPVLDEAVSPPMPDCPFARPAIRFDHFNLCPGSPGVRFNPSIIESGDGYLFSWRHGWAGCHIYAVRLDREFKPQGEPVKLMLRRSGATYGREDARWFRLNGRLHISYTGVVGGQGPTNVLFARINEDTLAVEDKFFPKGFPRQSWEKNHAYFDYQGVAHAVYSISPHRILKVEGNVAQFIHKTETTPSLKDRWHGGRLCGGASPVLHHGLWYHFFHGSTEWNGRRQYNMGLVCYSPKPPFEVVKFTPHPLDAADPLVPHDHGCDVLFPGGAVYKDGQWIIASGVHDRWSEIRFYDADWVESQLEDVA